MSMKRKVKVLLTCIGHQPKELLLRKIKESKKYNYQIIFRFVWFPPQLTTIKKQNGFSPSSVKKFQTKYLVI